MQKQSVLATLLGSVSALTVSVVLTVPSVAQDSSGTDSSGVRLEPIIVTGEKVDRSLQHTASSVEVLTSEDIEKKVGSTSVHEAIEDVPNVYYPGTVGVPIIRGQNTGGPNEGAVAFNAGTVPRTTINVDGRYKSYNEFVFGGTSIWDVESIEVFRGPQTTSQGANAVAGAIIVNTKDPTFTPESAFQLGYGSYNQKRASGMTSGAFSEDLAARVAIDYSKRDTFIDYVNPSFNQDDTNQDFMIFNATGKLLWLPEALPGLQAKLTLNGSGSNRPTIEAAFEPFEDLESDASVMPSWFQRTYTGIGDLDYDFGNGFALFNQTQYSDGYTKRSGPSTAGSAIIEQDNASNETRITFGREQDVLSGVAGVYYSHTESDEVLEFRGTSAFDDTKDNLGVFAEQSYRITDKWTLTTGLRYERDQVERVGSSVYATSDLDFEETYDEWLPKVSLAYDVTQDVTVGGLVSRGFNPGGVSLNFSSGEWIPYDPETVWNYELFTRARILDQRLAVTANLFFSDFTDAQRYIGVPLSTGDTQVYTVNAEEAYSYGLELGINYQVLDNLGISAGLGLLKTEITKMNDNTSYEGNEFGQAPGYMANLGASWNILPELNLSGDVRFVDGYFSDDNNTASFTVDSYMLANAQLTYQLTETFQLSGYVNNVLDERSPTYKRFNRSVGGTEGFMLAPRMIGIGLKATF